MRRLAVGLLLSLCCSIASATPSDLFFSEYIEGSSNNKALEIYNGTAAPVDLAAGGYNIVMYFNGSVTPATPIALTGTVPVGGTFVLAHASANATILAKANQTSSASFYNGDDAVVLRKGTTLLDVIGQIGFDPGSEWGTGFVSTADNTIRRKSVVCAGDTNGSDVFNPAGEWDGFATDTADGLGMHTADCSGGPGLPSLSIANATVDEGDSGTVDATFTVSLSAAAPAGGVTFDIATANGTALAGSDYVERSLSGQTIPAGSTTYTFTVQVIGDTATEANETFFVQVSNMSGAANSAAQAQGTIVDNDAFSTPTHIVISQVYGGGGNSNATFNRDYVELYNPTSGVIDVTGWTIQYASASGTNWSNYQPIGGPIGPGQYYLIALASGGAVGAELPEPNVSGDINMSATNGKIALVQSGSPLSGGCPASDPLVVDFVGYGTADCREGTTSAPAASNTLALFRKSGGNQDSNNNSNDFVTGTPVPRRTAPISEMGPWVVGIDPGNNAPRDASLTVNFSEPVNLDGGWFSIGCTVTGLHDDVAVNGGPKSWLITPNVTFQPGETCTITVVAAAVHDQDIDDSAPFTDTLVSNYVWNFTIATGSPAPFPADVHLMMGNPTNAIDDRATPDNFLMMKPEYALSYNRDRGTPNWVSWHLSSDWISNLTRVDTFRPDPALFSDWYRVLNFDYSGSGFDRGHMTPSADRTSSIPVNQATFLMTNMVPQAPDNNQGPWENFESHLRDVVKAGNEIYVVAGPAGIGGTGSNGFATTIAGGHVTVPAYTWKAALVLPRMDGNDVGRVDAATHTIAIVTPNIQGIRTTNPEDWKSFLTTVDQVEALCGCNLFSNVPTIVQNSIEAGIDGDNPPGVEDQTSTTNEDQAVTITLKAVNPDSDPLTWTIVTPPAHGTLTGSTQLQTYTPAPDFNGVDSFTFRVSDGTKTSNTATVTLNVTPVNDPPVLAAVAPFSIEAGGTATFTATATDIDLPAQPLSFSLSGAPAGASIDPATGLFTWTPSQAQVGSAYNFSVEVSDGVATTTGAVTIDVVDTTAPAMSGFALSLTRLWPVTHKMVDIEVAYTVTDIGDAQPACSLRVSSNEPLNGKGDGATSVDWQVIDAHHVQLRSERAGTGNGRVYTVTADCRDRFGNLAQNSGTVTVPKSEGN